MSTPRTNHHTFRLFGIELPMASLINEARRMEQELEAIKTPPNRGRPGRPRIPRYVAEQIKRTEGMTLKQASEATGVSPSTIDRYRRAK